jgi:hypothetical protein
VLIFWCEGLDIRGICPSILVFTCANSSVDGTCCPPRRKSTGGPTVFPWGRWTEWRSISPLHLCEMTSHTGGVLPKRRGWYTTRDDLVELSAGMSSDLINEKGFLKATIYHQSNYENITLELRNAFTITESTNRVDSSNHRSRHTLLNRYSCKHSNRTLPRISVQQRK